MNSSTTIAVVTGANRGIGLAICQQLASTFSKPLILYALSRQGSDIHLQHPNKYVQIRCARMSLDDEDSIVQAAKAVREAHGGCDVVINNAGIYHYKENISAAQRKETLDVNYRGTLKMCQQFIPIMKDKGRIVNVSSQSGLLKNYSLDIGNRFRDPNLTLGGLEQLVQEYEYSASNGTTKTDGWPAMTYSVSKSALNAVTRILASENPQVLINCCCPGWVNTDLGSQAGRPPKTVEQAASIPLRLGFKDCGGISGRYWSNRTVSDAGEGSVQEW